MPAADIANLLAAQFLANGNYETGQVSLRAQPAGVMPEEFFDAEAGFAGLAVQSVGYTSGADEEKVVIHVLRGSKRAFAALPERIGGAEVEIDVIGRLRAAPAIAGPSYFFERNNRIACGSSVGLEKHTGTLGALLRDSRNMYILSNNHVFGGCNHTTRGMPILSPSSRDSRSGRRGPTEIARHEQAIELRSGDPGYVPLNRLDVATAIVTDRNLVTSWQGDEEAGFDTPHRVTDLESGMRVKKFGRTTGLSTGIVYSYEATPWPLGYKHSDFTATAWFTDTWTVLADGVDPFALPGDSGSLVVTEDGRAAVGLLFAANTRGDHGTIIPIGDVLAGLGNLHLVSGHGI